MKVKFYIPKIITDFGLLALCNMALFSFKIEKKNKNSIVAVDRSAIIWHLRSFKYKLGSV